MSEAPVKVLLVDDDEDDYIITRDLILRIAGRYRLEWVNNFQAALDAIQRREHDIYLLDYRLGERTGLDLLRESQQLNARGPMILLTGQGDHEVDMQAMKAGAADYLVKGQLNADILDRAIRYAIKGKHAEENLRRDRDLISRIMETSPVGIVVADQTGKITFANHRAEEVLGLAKDAVARGTCSVLDWKTTDPEGHPLPGQAQPLKRSSNPASRCRTFIMRLMVLTATGPCFPPMPRRCSMPPARSTEWSSRLKTSPSGSCWKRNCGNPRKWSRSASWRPAWRMTSTIF